MHRGVPQLYDYLTDAAGRLPDKVALVCQGQRLTYGDLDRRSNAVAHALARRGVRRGDRVVVFDDNSVEAAVSFFGVLKANAVISMVNPQTKEEIQAFLDQLDMKLAQGQITEETYKMLSAKWQERLKALGG